MVGVAQLVRAPDCGSGCRGFESHLPPHKRGDRGHPGPLFSFPLGRRQVVRQGTLTPSSAGSSPAIPATPFRMPPSFLYMCHAPLAQSVEHLPFKQGVRGSNPRRGTIKAKQYRCRRPEAYGINCFRAFSARKFDDDSIDANHCFPLTGGIRTPSSQWLANPKPCGALFETATFKKGAIFLPIEYTKFGASICWS